MRLAVRLAHAWSIGASFLLVLILPPTFSLAHSSAQPQPASQVLAPSDLISNGRFVLGPRALDFDAAAYLQHRNSPLLPDAALIEAACAYASVNPQLVLTLLELDGRQVTQGWRSALPPEQREAAVLDTVTGLARSFYDHLYRWGERAPAGARLTPAPAIRLADGRAFQPPASASSGSFAVLDSLAPALTEEQLQRLLDPGAPDGFHATWSRLFPGTDPLDTSISITPEGLPPPDLLQFPFPVGQKWWFNGAHNWNGSGATYGKPYSSMDFFTSANSCSAPPAGDWAVAAAGGIGSHPGGALCWYRIDHGGGWITSYYHLRNVVPNGPVTANGIIGTLGCETCVGGSASGPHVHFSLLYNGAYTDLEGLVLSGWKVHSGSGDYSTGSLEREGVQLKPYSSVLNEGVRPRTPTPSPTASFTPTSTPTPTSTSTATPTSTPAATPASDLTPLPVSTFASTAGPIRLYLPMLID